MSAPIVPVFISSTWLDLEPERKAVEAAVHRMRETKFVGMEYFGSRDETTRRASLDEVDRSKVYVGIFGARYGSGITEDEYRRARERGLPCFIYFKDDATITDKQRETDPAQTAKLDTLKQELRDNHIIGPPFTNPSDLAAKVTPDLYRWLFDEYLTPILERAARGETSRAEAQALLAEVKDRSALKPNLLAQLTARHQLRAPVGDFVGREKEIAELVAALGDGGSVAISGISGMGGIGKTELALYVANQLRDSYPDAQLFIDMRSTDDPPREPADALAACVRAFIGLEQKLPDDLEELTRIYRSVLEGQRTLIVLDNASDSAQVRPLLPPAGSALIVASRRVITLPNITRVQLDQLQPHEARELLTRIAPRVLPNIADKICHLCDYLPLALRAAGSLLDVTIDLDPADYETQLSDERTRLERIGTEGVDIGVEASFNLSYVRLHPSTARVFRQLAVFAASFDAEAEEVVCEDPSHGYLSELLRRSLVLYNPATARYRLHDLMRLFAAARIGQEERSASQMRHAVHYLGVLDLARELYLQGGEAIKRGLSLFDLEWRNIQVGQSWAEKLSGENETAISLCMHYPNAGVYVLPLRQHPRERIRWLEAALAAARRLKNRVAEGAHLGNLGVVYKDLGEARRAIEYYDQALVIHREIGDRHSEGQDLGDLGAAYKDLGDVRRAIELHEQSLIIAREFGDRRSEVSGLNNLGNAYHALGDARRAIEFYEQVLTIARKMGDRQGEGSALGNLGNAQIALGEAHRALGFYEQQLIITREIGDRGGEGRALCGIGETHRYLGDARRAVEFYKQYLAITREISDRRNEGYALGNLGKAYYILGDARRAVEFYGQQLEIAREIGDRRSEGSALGSLGLAYAVLKENQPAIEYQRQWISIAREIGDRSGEGAALFNTGIALGELGDRAQAIAHAEAALEILEQIESPHVGMVRAALAQWRGQK